MENQDFILLGNGPSLETDIQNHFKIFKSSNLVVVNNFCQSPYFAQLKPKYYILLDPLFFSNRTDVETINNSRKAFYSKIDWEIEFHVPYSARNSEFIQELKKNAKISIIYFNFVSAKGGFVKINHLLYNRKLAIPQSQNVIVFSLFNLAQNGAKNVYLFGAENNWHVNVVVDNENYLILKDEHFYEESEEQRKKRMFLDLEKTKKTKMSDLLISSYKVFIGYENVVKYALTKNTKFYNCSSNSLIDAFDRMDSETFSKRFQ